jgi:hypothetical protein
MIKIFRLFFESFAYIALILSAVLGIKYLAGLGVESGYAVQDPGYCKDGMGQLMQIKKIISIDNSIAQVQLEDGSIKELLIRRVSRDYKGHVNIYHTYIKVNDAICVKN